jgi:hypothetical protein
MAKATPGEGGLTMQSRTRRTDRGPRRGALSAELAVFLPVFGLTIMAAMDFSRAFYYYLTITNCACNGAVYATSDDSHKADTTNITLYAKYDWPSNLSPQPTVTAGAPGTDAYGTYVNVTVTYPFNTIVSIPGIPRPLNMTRTVRMRVVQTIPDP